MEASPMARRLPFPVFSEREVHMAGRVALLAAMGVTIGCGGIVDPADRTNDSAPRAAAAATQSATYAVGGTVSGLVAGTLVLQNNGVDNLAAVANGPFTFATPLADGSSYKVTVRTQPFAQLCAVTSGSGAIAGGDVTNIQVSCSRTTGGGQGHCIYSIASHRLTGKCLDVGLCDQGQSFDCLGAPRSPIVSRTFCGPAVDRTPCMF